MKKTKRNFCTEEIPDAKPLDLNDPEVVRLLNITKAKQLKNIALGKVVYSDIIEKPMNY